MIWVAPAQAGGVCDLPTNSELSQCMSNEVAKAELDLSLHLPASNGFALRRQRPERRPPNCKEASRASERAWIAYKESYCGGFIGGVLGRWIRYRAWQFPFVCFD